MGTELVAMSKKELERLEVMRRVVEGRLTQAKAGEFIGLSERQVRRLCAAFKERGPAGLVSGKRGRPSNRRLPDELRLQAIEAIGPIRGVLPTRRFLPAVTKRSRPVTKRSRPARGRAMHRPRRETGLSPSAGNRSAATSWTSAGGTRSPVRRTHWPLGNRTPFAISAIRGSFPLM